MLNERAIEIFNKYNEKKATNIYLLGFKFKGNVYYGFFNEILDCWCNYSDTVNHEDKAIKFQPQTSKHKKNMVKEMNFLMTEKEFEKEVKSSKYNRGDIFEKIMFEKFIGKGTWIKNSVPFDKGSDIEFSGMRISVKFDDATICTKSYIEKI